VALYAPAAPRGGGGGGLARRRSRRNTREGGGGRRRSRPCIPPAPPQAAMALSTWVAAPLILASITRETRLGSLADKRLPSLRRRPPLPRKREREQTEFAARCHGGITA